MSQEYLQRDVVQSGSQTTATWASWIKLHKKAATTNIIWIAAASGASENVIAFTANTYNQLMVYDYKSGAYRYRLNSDNTFIDYSNWLHLTVVWDTTQSREDERLTIYLNGVRLNPRSYVTDTTDARDHELGVCTRGEWQVFGRNNFGGNNYNGLMSYSDAYLVDGVALNADAFGYIKKGKGNISQGSPQRHEYTKGMWVPKPPSVVKSLVESKGGFGVNGYYLPFNGKHNPGADFHKTPDTILKLKSDLPQPLSEIDGDPKVAVREDPFANYLELAIPGVLNGRDQGIGDYSGVIRNDSNYSNKTVTADGGLVAVNSMSPYYGSGFHFDGSDDVLNFNSQVPNFGTSDFTIEWWMNCDAHNGNYVGLLSLTCSTAADRFETAFYNNKFYIYTDTGSWRDTGWEPTNGNWYHIVLERHAGRLNFMVNGSVYYSVANTRNYDEVFGTARFGHHGSSYPKFDGKLSDLRIYVGVAKYKGSFDCSTVFTPKGWGSATEKWRTNADNPRNNFCCWEENSRFDGDMTDANWITTANDLMGTFNVHSGKWYYEVRMEDSNTGDGSVHHIGWSFTNYNEHQTSGDVYGAPDGKICIRQDNNDQSAEGNSRVISNMVKHGTTTAHANGDIIGVSVDLDGGKWQFFKNGVATSGGSFTYNPGYNGCVPMQRANGQTQQTNFGNNPSFCGNITTEGTEKDDTGFGTFKYKPPTGHLALCTRNLPEPAIPDPTEHFKPILYRGDDATGRPIPVGFRPDLIWFKSRNTVVSWVQCDSLRGPTSHLNSNGNNAQSIQDQTSYLRSFDDDGFTLSDGSNSGGNTDGRTYAAFCWRAGGEPTATNSGGRNATEGSVMIDGKKVTNYEYSSANIYPTKMSVNTVAGLSIIQFEGNGTNGATVAHGLPKKPGLILHKNIDRTQAWPIFHQAAQNSGNGATDVEYFSQHNTGTSDNIRSVNDETYAMTSWNGVNANNETNVAWCWHEVPGYSKFGRYVGNANSAHGPFINCGFKPAMVIIKGPNDYWCLHNSASQPGNDNISQLNIDRNIAESSGGNPINFVSNGFLLGGSNTGGAPGTRTNGSGTIYLYIAFAESPFKYANAK